MDVMSLVTAVLGAVLGGAIGWAVAHRVDSRGARRAAYGRYLGSLDRFLRVLRHRIELVARGVRDTEALPEMPTGRDVGAAFGEITVMCSRDMVKLVDQLQAAVMELEVWSFRAPTLADPMGGSWSEIDNRVRELRKGFIEAARKDSGDRELGPDFWEKTR